MSFQSTKISPIHLTHLRQGKLHRHSHSHPHSHSHNRNRSTDYNPSSLPFIELLAIRTSRNRSNVQTRQGAVTFSYRRWYDSAISFTSAIGTTNNEKAGQEPEPDIRPETERQIIRIRRLSDVNSRREQEGSPPAFFRRNLKCLRDKVNEKIRKVLQNSDARESQEAGQGITCNRITAWNIKPPTEPRKLRYRQQV